MKYLTQYVPQGSGEGMSDGYVAVEENGELKLQKLSFNGTEATPDGATEAIGNVGLFATGMDEPAYDGGGTGGAAKFYKCASVDTSNKTWSGYEVLLDDGNFVTISSEETPGLIYSVFTPAVGEIWSEDGMLQISTYSAPISFPVDFAFNIPLDQTSLQNGRILPYPNFGDTWQVSNTYVVQHQKELNGVKCMYFNYGASMYIETWSSLCAADATTANANTGCSARYGNGNPWTYSFWYNPSTDGENGEGGLFAVGYYYNNGYHRQLLLTYNGADGTFRLRTTSNDSISTDWSGYAEPGKWHHICVTAEADARTFKLYVDVKHTATLKHPSADIPQESYTGNPQIYIGGIWSNGCDYPAAGGYAKLKWYNRVLDTGEIAGLSQEIESD